MASALIALVLSGCVTDRWQHELHGVASVTELTEVPFFAQDDHQCGPAALATVLVHGDVEVTPEQLVAKIYVPDRHGSLQAELLAAARSHGRVPYLLSGSLSSVLEEVGNGRPVLVLQNLGFERWPIWHYAVLIGYVAEDRSFLLRSGPVPRHEVSARRFLKSWKLGERWAMVVVQPSEIPASADALRWLRAVAPFESTGRLAIAAVGYKAGVKRWPGDALVWTALGNVRYLQQDLAGAEKAYGQALALAPEHWPARNNLVNTLMARGCVGRAWKWTDAVGNPPAEFSATWNRTLEELAGVAESRCESLGEFAR